MTATSVEEMRRARDNRLRQERKKRAIVARSNGLPYGLIDAAPIRKHLKALARLDWSWMAIAHLHGDVTHAGVRRIALGWTTEAEQRMDRLLAIPLSYHVPDLVPDHVWVPAHGARRRAQGLHALGWTHDHIIDASGGYNAQSLVRDSGPTIMTALNWRRVDRAFRALSAEPGPSQRNRLRAKANGYVPPAAWDDIDNPLERPKGTT